MTHVLFSPHNDDETLFAAFTILQYHPHVVVCIKSSGDHAHQARRERETRDAMAILGSGPVEQWDGRTGDLSNMMRELDARVKPSLVFAPNERAAHFDHVTVAVAARDVFTDRVRTYHTYDKTSKVTSEHPARYEPEWVLRKLRALACYESQATHPRRCEFFLFDMHEYLGE